MEHNSHPTNTKWTITWLTSLIAPFSENEITHAFFQINSFASSGLDGFGLGFYKKYWKTIKQIKNLPTLKGTSTTKQRILQASIELTSF
jgi:hypothetical protein